jgi:hypothetical protein
MKFYPSAGKVVGIRVSYSPIISFSITMLTHSIPVLFMIHPLYPLGL